MSAWSYPVHQRALVYLWSSSSFFSVMLSSLSLLVSLSPCLRPPSSACFEGRLRSVGELCEAAYEGEAARGQGKLTRTTAGNELWSFFWGENGEGRMTTFTSSECCGRFVCDLTQPAYTPTSNSSPRRNETHSGLSLCSSCALIKLRFLGNSSSVSF